MSARSRIRDLRVATRLIGIRTEETPKSRAK
jgi:hypothetical protein